MVEGTVCSRFPLALKNPEYRFILVRPRDKPALEKGWNDPAQQYLYNESRFTSHLERGFNYGVLPGFGNLCFFDADEPHILAKIGILQIFKGQTFTVKTSKGYHFYFICEAKRGKIPLFEKETKIHVGEVYLSGAFFVVGPGSIHPSGIEYEVIDDKPLLYISPDELDAILELVDVVEKEAKPIPRKEHKYLGSSLVDKLHLSIDQFITRGKDVGNNEYVTAHPVHGSTTGTNLSINTNKNTWVCRRCNSGGDPLIWIAVEEGIIDCSDAGSGCLDPRYHLSRWEAVLDALERRGYNIDEWRGWNKSKAIEDYTRRSSELSDVETQTIETLPEDLPDKEVILLKAPPRTGKSTWSIQQMIKRGSGTYLSQKHIIIEEQILRIFNELDHGKHTAVWVVGKTRGCNNTGPDFCKCGDCPKYPINDFAAEDEHCITVSQQTRESESLLRKHRILTPKHVPITLCPYYTCFYADKRADFCFTVPYFLTAVDEKRRIRVRDLLVIDEDPTVDHFFPSCVNIATFSYRADSGSIAHKIAENYLNVYIPSLEKIERDINAMKRKSKHKKIILAIIQEIKKINTSLEDLNEAPKGDKKAELLEKLLQIDMKSIVAGLSTVEKQLITKELYDYQKEIPIENEIDDQPTLVELFEPFLYPHNRSFVWIGKAPSDLHLVSELCINKTFDTKEQKHKQILLIGRTNAQLFMDLLCKDNPERATCLYIPQFKYADSFKMLILEGETKHAENAAIYKFIHAYNRVNRASITKSPAIAIVSTKKGQENLKRLLSAGAITITNEKLPEILHRRYTGDIGIVYENSNFTRGIDVPEFDLMFLMDSNFATPRWSATLEWLKTQEGDHRKEIDEVNMIIANLLVDETTNATLRISPINPSDIQPKIVVIKSHDLAKVDIESRQGMYEEILNIEGFDYETAGQMLSNFTKNYHICPVLGKEPKSAFPVSHILLPNSEGEAVVFRSGGGHKADLKSRIISLRNLPLIRDTDTTITHAVLNYPNFKKNWRVSRPVLEKYVYKQLSGRVSKDIIHKTVSNLIQLGKIMSEMDTKKLVAMLSIRNLAK